MQIKNYQKNIKIRGPISFESLRTVNGQLHLTFKSTFKALELLKDDEHLYAALPISTYDTGSIYDYISVLPSNRSLMSLGQIQ